MKKILSIVCVLSFMNCFGQIGSKKTHFIIPVEGDTVVGPYLSFHSEMLSDSYFTLGESKFHLTDVKFLRNDHGYFANLAPLGMTGERFAMRTDIGKISVFEEIDIRIYSQENLLENKKEKSTPNSKYLASGNELDYYTKYNGDIRAVKYKYLSVDFADNENSMSSLKRYRALQWLQRSMLGGGAAMVGSQLAFAQNDQFLFSPLMMLGLALGGSSMLFESSKEEILWEAIEVYNE